jgi:hypothetical protein
MVFGGCHDGATPDTSPQVVTVDETGVVPNLDKPTQLNIIMDDTGQSDQFGWKQRCLDMGGTPNSVLPTTCIDVDY